MLRESGCVACPGIRTCQGCLVCTRIRVRPALECCHAAVVEVAWWMLLLPGKQGDRGKQQASIFA